MIFKIIQMEKRLLILILVYLNPRHCLGIKKIHVLEVIAVNGGIASLPCDVSHPTGDTITLLLWFRDGRTTPLYRFDARSSSKSSNRWADDVLEERVSVDVSSDPARLLVKTMTSDEGFYYCRVDFQMQPTKTTRVHLSVVVPPTNVLVYQDSDFSKALTRVVGPYDEGEMLILTCVASGGSPSPQVVWYEGTHLLDSVMESDQAGQEETVENATSVDNGGLGSEPTDDATTESEDSIRLFEGRSLNVLTLGPLTRSHLKMLLTCEASNNNITLPTSQVVMVDMNLPPLGIIIKLPELPLEASKDYQLECVVFGGRPPPEITWWRDSQQITTKTTTFTTDGNITSTVLHLTPSASDDGSEFKCKAESKSTSTFFEKNISIVVHYVPRAKARFGTSLDGSNIKEGDDVYFECLINANPRMVRVSWRHDNNVLIHNVTAGVIVSNQSLVLQRVTRKQAGLYTCHAFNVLGDGISNAQRLDVKYSPVCSANQITTYAVSRHEDAEVTCKVDANPARMTFHWTFNNTADTIDVPNGRYTTASSHSVITYTPVTTLDYGTLLCWASNDIGMQREPCLFHIVPAGKPEAPANCTLARRLRTSIRLVCMAGDNRGFDQAFHLQVSQDGRMLVNMTRDKPAFKIDNLSPGQKYRFTITAENERGLSFQTHLSGHTLSVHGTIYKDGPSEAEVRDGGKPGNGFLPLNTSSYYSSRSSLSPVSLLDALDVDAVLHVATGVGGGMVLIIVILVALIVMRARLLPEGGGSVRSQSEHAKLHSFPQGSLDGAELSSEPEHDLTAQYRHVDSETKSNGIIDQRLIPLKDDNFKISEGPSDPSAAVTLLPPEQYGFSLFEPHRQPLVKVPSYEGSRVPKHVSVSPSSELLCEVALLSDSRCQRQECQSPAESSTLPRRLHLHCHNQQQYQNPDPHYHHFHHYPSEMGENIQAGKSTPTPRTGKKCCSIAQDYSSSSHDDASQVIPIVENLESSV